jgi:hypothetical protein
MDTTPRTRWPSARALLEISESQANVPADLVGGLEETIAPKTYVEVRP